ncbi:MAG: DUF2845 domain-containing protein [Pseudomonadota bacterium]
MNSIKKPSITRLTRWCLLLIGNYPVPLLKRASCLLILWGIAMPAQALRCDHDLVPDQASFSEVSRICGPPTDTQQWIEYRIVPVAPYYPSPSSQGRRRPNRDYSSTYVTPIVIPVNVEEWTYNFGPTRLIHVLRFEKGHLQSIRTSGRGY